LAQEKKPKKRTRKDITKGKEQVRKHFTRNIKKEIHKNRQKLQTNCLAKKANPKNRLRDRFKDKGMINYLSMRYIMIKKPIGIKEQSKTKCLLILGIIAVLLLFFLRTIPTSIAIFKGRYGFCIAFRWTFFMVDAF